MADPNSTQTVYDKINKLISSSRFNEAFLLLKSNMSKFIALKADLEKLNNTESTYKYMLDFISEGHNDPSRDEMMEQIRNVLQHSNDILRRELKLADSSDLYSSTRRFEQLRKTTIHQYLENYRKTFEKDSESNPRPLESPVISPSQALTLNELFNYVWTMNGVDAEEYDTLAKALEDPSLPEHFKALMISAIVLGNLTYFDASSFEILLNQFDTSESSILKARAITGIILISLLNSERISRNINLRSRLTLSMEDDEFKKIINDVLIRIVRTYDTKRIDSKMRNEVIPGLMKLNPEILNKIRDLTSDSENHLSDANPEWEEIMKDSGISEKLQEINELQMEGADVMVTAFSNLKTFPFFNQISNWFLPFVPGHFEFENLPIEKDEETVSRLTTVMCDSDLNSFLLSLKSMPESHRNRVVANIESQMKEAKEALTSAIGETEYDRLAKKIRHSLQDLYRFFKFFRKKDDFNDPFGSPFLASHIGSLLPLFGISTENVRVIAEFYFKNKYYDEASGMFELFDSLEPGDFNIWEKTGFSHDRMQRYDKAVDWYKKAELLNPGSNWLTKKLAISLKNAGYGEKAVEYYRKALNNEPENYHLLMSAAQCLLDTGNYEEALKHFYHAQYLRPEKQDVIRAIAWTELMAGNFEKASAQYQKILESDHTDKTDTLNAGHCALASGDFKNALKLYKNFVEKTDNKDITGLVIAFRDDSEALKKIGIKTSDLRLIIDKIRYDLLG